MMPTLAFKLDHHSDVRRTLCAWKDCLAPPHVALTCMKLVTHDLRSFHRRIPRHDSIYRMNPLPSTFQTRAAPAARTTALHRGTQLCRH